MFAYSSIEHAGIIMLGIAAGGIGYYAAILHIILHAFIKSSLFFQQGQIYRIYQSKSIYDVGNYFKYNPTGSIVMLLAFFFATAMPPSASSIIPSAVRQRSYFLYLGANQRCRARALRRAAVAPAVRTSCRRTRGKGRSDAMAHDKVIDSDCCGTRRVSVPRWRGLLTSPARAAGPCHPRA